MKKINLGFKLKNKFHQKEVISQLRKAYGIKKIFTWARPLICPFDKFIFQIPKNQSIFDVGCGDGLFLYLIAIFRKPRKLFGVDVIDTDLDKEQIELSFVTDNEGKLVHNFKDWSFLRKFKKLKVLKLCRAEILKEFSNKIFYSLLIIRKF